MFETYFSGSLDPAGCADKEAAELIISPISPDKISLVQDGRLWLITQILIVVSDLRFFA